MQHFLDSLPLLVLATALTAACGWAARAWLRSLGSARTSEDLPTAKIRSAAQGYVELQGFARTLGDQPLTSPLLGARCVWWSYVIRKAGGEHEESVYEARTSSAPFYIEDPTGRCLIDPLGAELTPSWSRTWVSARPAAPSQAPAPLTFLPEPLYTCTESVLVAGTRLYVRGEFRTVRKAAQPLDLMRDKLAAWLSDEKKRAIIDVNRDGQLDATELEAARRAALLEARREAGTLVGTQDVVGKPADGRPFIIAPRLERAHVRHARTWAMFYLAGAILSAAGMIWILAKI